MSSSSSTNPLVILCSFLAPFASVVVFLAPIPTIRQIQHDRSVGNLPLLPYTSMFCNAFVWTTYGILRPVHMIWTSNGIGFLLSIYYVKQFLQYNNKVSSSPTTLPGSVKTHLQVCTACILITLFVAMSPLFRPHPDVPIGRAGVCICLIMFASPLAALKTVLESKSAKAIPLPFTIASTLNCVFWTVSGWWDLHDANVYVTNGTALIFGLIQLALKLHFGDGPKTISATTTRSPASGNNSSNNVVTGAVVTSAAAKVLPV